MTSRSRSRSPIDDRVHPKNRNFRDENKPASSSGQRSVYVKNIPFTCRWSELKDLFREKIGEVGFVDFIEDNTGRFSGNAIVEFKNPESVEKAIEVLDKFDFKGRPLAVREDRSANRNGAGGGGFRGGPPQSRFSDRGPSFNQGPPSFNRPGFNRNSPQQFNTYGLSPQFLESLNITGPLAKKVFIINLAFNVDEGKLKDVFALAGNVVKVEIKKDAEGKSKGHALVEFEHPVEAVQAISMFNNQKLFNRPMSIRMDRYIEDGGSEKPKLPSGLQGIGKGLGNSGQALQIPKTGGIDSVAPINPTFPAAMGGTGMMGNFTGGNVGMNSTTSGFSTGYNSSPVNLPINNMASQGLDRAPLTTPTNYQMGGLGYNGSMNNMMSSTPTNIGGGYGMDSFNSSQGLGGTGGNSFGGGMQRGDTVILRNLPFNVTWQILKDRFRDVGDIRHVEVKDRGTALVRFGSERDAGRAVDLMHGLRVDGRAIEVALYN